MESEGITHRKVEVNGINMHIAEKGEGPTVLLIHGFPELWYTWRHQILALSARGYRAVAPDLRGFGDTDSPPSPSSYTVLHVVGDLVALISALGLDQVFVVGHDWGAVVAWHLCLFRPDKVKALVNMSVAYPAIGTTEHFRRMYGDDHYIVRFQEPGVMEKLFSRYGTEHVLKRFLTYRNPGPLYIDKELGNPLTVLPSWLTQEDIQYFTTKFEKSGFTGGFNYYRCLDRSCELTAPWAGAQIKVPTKFIIGDLDLTYHYPGIQDHINKGGLEKYVPFLQDLVIMKDVGHFINQERAAEVTEHIYDFIQKFG